MVLQALVKNKAVELGRKGFLVLSIILTAHARHAAPVKSIKDDSVGGFHQDTGYDPAFGNFGTGRKYRRR